MSTRKPRGRIGRIFLLLAAVAMIVAAMPLAGAAANGVVWTGSVDLLADGRADDGTPPIDVGDVEVWNDANYLYVDYKITDSDWCLTKTALDVETSETLIPQTKKNNPIPGKFEFTADHDCVSEYGYMIPMTWAAEDTLAIAAHANVWDMTSAVTETLTLSDEYHDIMVYGPLDHYAIPGHADWGTTPVPAVETWKHSAWPMITDSDAIWISNEYKIGDLGGSISDNSWRLFSDDFEVPGYPMSAYVVNATADNAEEVYLNGVLVGSDGEIDGPFSDNHEWNTIQHYDITPTMGYNTLDFVVRNYSGTSSPTSNPTGLIYDVEVEYLTRSETAWGDGADFGGKQWGMWFNYTVEEVLVETVLVPSDGSTVSSMALMNDAGYELRASGTYRFANWGAAGVADAQCSLRPPNVWYSFHTNLYDTWVNGDDLPATWENYLEVMIDGVAFGWNPADCNETEHLYTGSVDGGGSSIDFQIVDSSYGDNSDGDLQVEIWWLG